MLQYLDMSHDLVHLNKKTYLQKIEIPTNLSTDSIYTQIHGMDMEMNFSSPAMRGWIMEKLSAYNCPLWESKEFRKQFGPNHLFVNWIDVCDVLNISAAQWGDDADDDLEVFIAQNKEWAFQRDFAGVSCDAKIEIFCATGDDDGFFNALRWFLPRHLVSFNSIVMHSSSFVDQNGWAHLFVGQSGVGKTTTVTRILGHTILGDDMILISVAAGKVFAETPVLGQNPRFAGKAGQRFPLKSINFLRQGPAVTKTAVTSVDGMLRLSTSLLYPTWNFETQTQLLQIRALLESIIKTIPCFELTLDKSTPFLGVVDESYK